MSRIEFKSDCKKCGDCCRTLKIHIPTGIDKFNADFLKVRGLEVGKKYVKLDPFVCPHLTSDNLCDIYHKARPIICISWKCKKKW